MEVSGAARTTLGSRAISAQGSFRRVTRARPHAADTKFAVPKAAAEKRHAASSAAASASAAKAARIRRRFLFHRAAKSRKARASCAAA